MLPMFLVLRACLYGAVFIATLICLAMAGHFQSVLASTDLTRFVPFALFVCCISLLVISCLLGFSFLMRERSPISTRHELASLGSLGVLWLALGVFLSTSDSQSADVECFASDSPTVALDDSTSDFQTEQYRAMYHVLMAFSLINAALVIFAFLVLLTLAMRRHMQGDNHMWYGPVTAGMVKNYSTNLTNQPRRSRRSKAAILPTVLPPIMKEKRSRSGRHTSRHRSQPSTSRRAQPPQRQDSSGNSSLISTHHFNAGRIANPNVPEEPTRRPSK
ncbi:hypothetical protein B0H12DRAFT_1041423 [Mycena haematopus]|nr:hypothetical protein B0H12DRAFT_1041423 [Mycena haematopus]